MNKFTDPGNKETYKSLDDAFGSIKEGYDKEGSGTLQKLIDKFMKVIGVITPVADLVEPFMKLKEIFTGKLEAELSDNLEFLFNVVLSDFNIAKITSITDKLGTLFSLIFTNENIDFIAETTSNILDFFMDPFGYVLARTKTLWELFFGWMAQFEAGWWGAL